MIISRAIFGAIKKAKKTKINIGGTYNPQTKSREKGMREISEYDSKSGHNLTLKLTEIEIHKTISMSSSVALFTFFLYQWTEFLMKQVNKFLKPLINHNFAINLMTNASS